MAATADVLEVDVEHPLVVLNVHGEDFALIRYKCARKVVFDFVIYTRHPQEVKALFRGKAHEPGEHHVNWDGTDEFGEHVEDGYYFLKAIETDSGATLFDSAESRWGAPITATDVDFLGDGTFQYTLPANAAVRVGVADAESDAYLRTVLDWAPRPRGSHLDFWSGYDNRNNIPLLGAREMSVYVRSYTLPNATLFVTGSATESIPVRTKGVPYVVPPEGRGEVSPFALQEELAARTPEFTLHAHGLAASLPGLHGAVLTEPLELHIVLDSDTLREIGSYSVKIYVDEELVGLADPADPSYSFLLDPSSYEPGKHLLIVNVISEAGCHVGSELREFEVPAEPITVGPP